MRTTSSSLDEVLAVRVRQASEIETWLAEVMPDQLAKTAPVPDDDRWPPYAKVWASQLRWHRTSV